jgi:hypothetical protein
MRFAAGRNQIALTERQIAYCLEVWAALCADQPIALNTSAERFQLVYRRPTDLPDVLLDEAETSLRASFTSLISPKDREDLVEDARDRLIQWLALHQQEGETDAQSGTERGDPARGL